MKLSLRMEQGALSGQVKGEFSLSQIVHPSPPGLDFILTLDERLFQLLGKRIRILEPEGPLRKNQVKLHYQWTTGAGGKARSP